MGVAIGIDLGTTNSVAAIKRGDVRVLQNRENEDLTPSVVGFYKEQLIVGKKALDRIAASPKETVISVKRLMGRAFKDPEVQRVRSKYRYSVAAPSNGTEDDVRVILGGKEYSPIEISSFILKKIKEDAEMRLNDKVEYAVITVPAYFNERQREATLLAGQMAGLKVQRILDEPTAAAIAFGVDNVGADDARTVLVFDLGGGTFDISVLNIVGGIFAQVNLEGDMWLGGDDFDWKLMQHVLQHIKDTYGFDPAGNDRFMESLRLNVRKAKETLSSLARTDISMVGQLSDKSGNLIDIELEVTRDVLERMIGRDAASGDGHRTDVERSFELVMRALEGPPKTAIDQIDYVLLVGGSSCIPMIRRRLIEMFGEKKVRMDVDPMKCVAFGAAILAASIGEHVICSKGHPNPGTAVECGECKEPLIHKVDLARVTAMHYGIQAKGDKFEIIIPKGSPYPSPEPVTRAFKTPTANLRRLKIPVHAGTEDVATKNELQQTVWLELPEHLPAGTRVDVGLKLSSDGILDSIKVKLHDGSGREVEVFRDRGGEKRSRVERKIEDLRKKIDENREKLSGEAAEQCEQLYEESIKAINERHDLDAAEKKLQELAKVVDGATRPDWKRTTENMIGYAEFALREFGSYLKPEESYKIKKLVEEVQKAMEDDNEELALQKREEMVKAVDANRLVQWLMTLIIGISRANNQHDSVSADKLKVALRNTEDAWRRGDVDAVNRIINETGPVLDKVFGPGQRGSSGFTREDYVERA
ncbi:MAG TPA: Hsp70 family protein [Candidatus Nitrosotenuis sp.]|nr:Hsp70 family protein [Candidatus Nitrosotenuis sp.]